MLKTPILARLRVDVGAALAREFARIGADLEAMGAKRTEYDSLAALCQGLDAVIRAQLAAGHPEPLFLVSALAKLSDSSRENPYRSAHKMVSIRAELDGGVNPTALTERTKRALSIALINLLMKHGETKTTAAHIVAGKTSANAGKLLTARENANRSFVKDDVIALQNRAAEHVKAAFAQHQSLASTVDAVCARIRAI